MKTHARFLIVAVIIILVTGCDLFDSDSKKGGPAQPSLIARLDLANAHSLAVAGVGSAGGSSFSASSSGQGTVLLKFDEAGNFEPVVHYDVAGNPMGVPNPLEARNINDDWIALFYSDWATIDTASEANHAYVVQKSTGDAYRLPQSMSVMRTIDGFSRAVGGHLYLVAESYDTSTWSQYLYRITPGTEPVATQVSLSVDAVAGYYYPGDTGADPSFVVGNDGTIVYNSSSTNDNWSDQRTRVVFSDGSVGTLANEISVFWRTPDGNVYWIDRNDDWENPDEILRPYRGDTGVENEVYATMPADSSLWPWSTRIISTGTQVIGVDSDSGNVYELYRLGFGEGDTLRVTSLTGSWAWNAVSHIAWAGDTIVFLVNGEMIPLDPAFFTVGAVIAPATGSYEFYSIQPYTDQEIMFSGLRTTDGAVVTGRINIVNGTVTIASAEQSFEVIQLERIN